MTRRKSLTLRVKFPPQTAEDKRRIVGPLEEMYRERDRAILTTAPTRSRPTGGWQIKRPAGQALGSYIDNWRELGQDGMCRTEPWMLQAEPGKTLTREAEDLARMVGINNALAGRTDVAEKIAATMEAYGDVATADSIRMSLRKSEPEPGGDR